jgi:two-component system chemotaxis response regulator CheB
MEAARRVDEQSEAQQTESQPSTVSEAADDRLQVLIVDDSPMMRKILSSMLTTSNQIKVVGTASNGKEAIAMIDDLSPDLVTLDVNMPVMDGTSMIRKPCPVVITSNPGEGSSKAIFNFLELGAVDFLSKPTKNQDIVKQQLRILERVRVAATATVGNFRIARVPKVPANHVVDQPSGSACHSLVILISGPGGHPEQMSLVSGLMPSMLAIDGAVLAIQDLPPTFGSAFAGYIHERCGCPASSIESETVLKRGSCYVGIQGCALMVKKNDHQPTIDPFADSEAMAPVDRLLSSAASVFKQRLTVVLLSGANTGSLSGITVVRENGGRIILRERATSMVRESLDMVVEAGLLDAEVNTTALVTTITEGYDQQP